MILQKYDFEIKHCSFHFYSVIYEAIDMDLDIRNEIQNIQLLQDLDETINQIKNNIKCKRYENNYLIHEKVVFCQDHSQNNWQVVVPTDMTIMIMDHIHLKLAHPGYYKTFMNIRQFFYWTFMSSDIRNVCNFL